MSHDPKTGFAKLSEMPYMAILIIYLTSALPGLYAIRLKHRYAVEKFQDYRRLIHLKGPAVIIAGSGMCTGGRIVNHLKHGLDDPENDLLFVGYQVKGTPGRAIVEGRTPAKAAIHRLTGSSAHADQQTLCEWVKSMKEPPGEIRLVHGEPEAPKALKSTLDVLF
jgi:metallo-beta-lactamase family protein